MGKRLGIICGILGLLVTAASADSIGQFQVTGVGGENLGGVYVAPYQGHLSTDGGKTYGSVFNVICDDYTHDIGIGDAWNVNITDLGVASPNLGNTRFGLADGGLSIYSQIVWLAQQMDFTTQKNSDLQWAIWYLTDATYDSTGTLLTPILNIGGLPNADQSNILSLVSQAENHKSGVDLSGWEVITPSGGAGSTTAGFGQEYLTKVPEPSSLLLLGSGLIGTIGFYRRKSYR